VIAFVAAVLAAYILAVLMYTQLNLANVVEMGLTVTMADRVSAALHDLWSMNLLLVLLVVAFAIAFAVTHFVLRLLPQLRFIGYILAGALAIYVLDYSLFKVMGDMHVLAVTRTTVGTLAMCLAGAVGGYVFVRLLPPPANAA
jgi:hypothetical protein